MEIVYHLTKGVKSGEDFRQRKKFCFSWGGVNYGKVIRTCMAIDCLVGFVIQNRVVSGVVLFLVLEREVTFQMGIYVLLLAR